jgi:hypothetical protein
LNSAQLTIDFAAYVDATEECKDAAIRVNSIRSLASQVGSTCAANARLREPNGMPLSGRGGTCATLLFNLATTMVFCRSVNEMIAFYHR